jgi:hypothetical protein
MTEGQHIIAIIESTLGTSVTNCVGHFRELYYSELDTYLSYVSLVQEEVVRPVISAGHIRDSLYRLRGKLQTVDDPIKKHAYELAFLTCPLLSFVEDISWIGQQKEAYAHLNALWHNRPFPYRSVWGIQAGLWLATTAKGLASLGLDNFPAALSEVLELEDRVPQSEAPTVTFARRMAHSIRDAMVEIDALSPLTDLRVVGPTVVSRLLFIHSIFASIETNTMLLGALADWRETFSIVDELDKLAATTEAANPIASSESPLERIGMVPHLIEVNIESLAERVHGECFQRIYYLADALRYVKKLVENQGCFPE